VRRSRPRLPHLPGGAGARRSSRGSICVGFLRARRKRPSDRPGTASSYRCSFKIRGHAVVDFVRDAIHDCGPSPPRGVGRSVFSSVDTVFHHRRESSLDGRRFAVGKTKKGRLCGRFLFLKKEEDLQPGPRDRDRSLTSVTECSLSSTAIRDQDGSSGQDGQESGRVMTVNDVLARANSWKTEASALMKKTGVRRIGRPQTTTRPGHHPRGPNRGDVRRLLGKKRQGTSSPGGRPIRMGRFAMWNSPIVNWDKMLSK
jgi:hypothetical protein